ncbi:MAG: hypothetical protein JWP29_236 [Rhodoferax sp.]|nr:hypothetical protein [Rhodoferax sp.]
MRIKTLLVALVAGVALPLVLLAGYVTYQLWQQQRLAYQQQYLERASAVRLALDTEFAVTQRTLRAAGDATEIPSADTEVVLLRRFRRLLDNYPHWVAVALTDAQGRVIMTAARPGTPAPPTLPAEDMRRTMASATGFISNVVTTADGRHVVFVAAAIMRKDATQGVIYAVIPQAHWLDLLRAYPVSQRGTLTLFDKNATVVTRTLDTEKWVAAKAPPAYWDNTIGRSSGIFKGKGLDSKPYYIAFSRSEASGWLLSAGVPQDEVDEALYWPTLAVLLAALVAVLGALTAAWRLGRDIHLSFSGLLASANALGDPQLAPPVLLPINEARTVGGALAEAHRQLLMREASLNASLEREAIARRQAESSSRAKDQFLAMMGHELRNPLSTITSAVELLWADLVSHTQLSRSRDIIRRQARHLTAMVNDLMDVAQLDSDEIVLHKTQVDLAQLAARVLLRFEETGRCTHLQIRIAHAPAWIEADEARIEFLITHLLDNACKYTPPGGAVTLEVLAEPDCSVLRVVDTGVGIAAEATERMFDAFTQGERGIDRSQGGVGLGLTLARKLVHLHGGEITVASAGPGQGSTFAVRFPRVASPVRDAVAATPSRSRELLLTIVEDIADNREMLMLLLESEGRKINGAADGPSGVQLILAGPSDIAVVDIGLPGFDGMEVARRVRQSADGHRVLLIALTGFGTEGDRSRALAAGFDDFLVKPFDPERLEAAIVKGLAAKELGDVA